MNSSVDFVELGLSAMAISLLEKQSAPLTPPVRSKSTRTSRTSVTTATIDTVSKPVKQEKKKKKNTNKKKGVSSAHPISKKNIQLDGMNGKKGN